MIMLSSFWYISVKKRVHVTIIISMCIKRVYSLKTHYNFLAIALFLRKLDPKRGENWQTNKLRLCGFKKCLERDHHESEIFPTRKGLPKSRYFYKVMSDDTFKNAYVTSNCKTSFPEVG